MIYISRGQQKRRRTTQKLFTPADLLVKMLKTEGEKCSTLLVSFNMQRISIVLLSQQSLLPNLHISNTFLLFSNFDPSFRGSVARTH